MRKENSAFLYPVDPIQLDLEDYNDIIDMPMDLGTVLTNIPNYTTFDDFWNEISLVWQNATQYNPKNHGIYNAAEKLEETIKKGLENNHFALVCCIFVFFFVLYLFLWVCIIFVDLFFAVLQDCDFAKSFVLCVCFCIFLTQNSC